MNQWPLPCQ